MKRTVLLSAVLLWASVSLASTVPIVHLELVSFDGPFVNLIPTYPYTLSSSISTRFYAMCDDYYHDGTPGDVWSAFLTNLGTGSLQTVRFASSGLPAYEEAAWLLQQTYVTPSSQWPDMNYAVWHIFNPTVPINSNAQNWIDLAIANYAGGNYSNIYVATPIQIHAPPTGEQEFLLLWNGIPPFNPQTPEPAPVVLLATGALGALAGLRRRNGRYCSMN